MKCFDAKKITKFNYPSWKFVKATKLKYDYPTLYEKNQKLYFCVSKATSYTKKKSVCFTQKITLNLIIYFETGELF